MSVPYIGFPATGDTNFGVRVPYRLGPATQVESLGVASWLRHINITAARYGGMLSQ